MDNYKPQVGDIFLNNSDRFASKMVKFLMQSPTIWHQIYRWFFNCLEPVRYYHAGIVIGENEICEQQGKVQKRDLQGILSRDIIFYRKKGLTDLDKQNLLDVINLTVGGGYGISECFAKLLAWLTGIQKLAKMFDMKNRAICVVRVAEYYKVCNLENFGVDNVNYITTKVMDEFCSKSENWEVVYKN
jgi:hypothetical protein